MEADITVCLMGWMEMLLVRSLQLPYRLQVCMYVHRMLPCYVLTYAQVEFALAEGAKINWIGGGDAVAEDHYNAAVEASVRQWNRISFKNYDADVDEQIEKVPYNREDEGDITGPCRLHGKT